MSLLCHSLYSIQSILAHPSPVSGDKESKKKQKSPGPAQQVVVMRELKWDHQVRIPVADSKCNFQTSSNVVFLAGSLQHMQQ